MASASLKKVVAKYIWSQILGGKVSIERTARFLDMSVRSLQRSLSREGTDFRTLVNEARSRKAAELLIYADASIGGIARSLGYSTPTHFARAFRKATGVSPRAFRQR